ncbi:MAG: YidC/Oxa1 family membrane protein insertase [Clostridiaceae bacterium]|jgi:YidC/Oxa1 family membrane protein insertase|nr:YidC/Oxa1 family membrane protein insertase [Clostridiaceae bacterium]
MTSLITVQLGLLDPLYSLFGWILGSLYTWLNSYGLVIILFTILIRLVLMPLGLRSQRSTLRQQTLQPEVNEIKRRYPKDQARVQELTQQLYKDNGISMMSGCLPTLLQLVVIWPIIYIFRAPLRFISSVDMQGIYKMANLLEGKGLMTAAQVKNVASMDIPVLNGLNASGSALQQSVSNGWIQLPQFINTKFLGIDLGMTPAVNPLKWFGADWRIQLPLVLLIIITMLTYFFQMQIMRKSTARPEKTKEEKRREKANPAKRGQNPDPGAGMMKSMNLFMPLIMLFTMFSMPAAMCLYWLFQNVMYIIQSAVGYEYYVKPLRLAHAEEQAVFDRSRSRESSIEGPEVKSGWQAFVERFKSKKDA